MRLIDADAFVAWIESVMTKEELSPAAAMVLSLVEGKLVIDTPKVDAEPVRHGRWIWDDEGYHCSECFFHAYGNTLECLDGTYRFCPNCGARMDEEVEK